MGMTELYIHINGMGLAQYKIRVFTTWHTYYMNNVYDVIYNGSQYFLHACKANSIVHL